jgi:hypothetical protein
MAIVLLIVGLLTVAAGLVTIGFGIPINAFSLGNTLIVAGTVALSAGLVLIGLASVLGQLRRIAEALAAQQRSGARTDSVESLIPPTARLTPRQPAPVPAQPSGPAAPEPVQPEARMPEPRQSSPYVPAPAPNEPPGPLDWLRSKPRLASMATQNGVLPPETPMAEVTDEAPLSPRPVQRPTKSATEPPTLEPKPWPQSRSAGVSEPRPAARTEHPLARSAPHTEAPSGRDQFDLVWPEHSTPEQPVESGHRPAASEAQPLARPRDSRFAERRPELAPKPAAERGPAILKSGVIDGMPYTLYADGSIEAELPQGTLKFASVDELRAHLERNG